MKVDIIYIYLKDWKKVTVEANWLFLICFFVFCFLIIYLFKKLGLFAMKKHFTIDEAKLGIGNESVTLKYNRKDQEVAYKLWVELATRKIGLEFDPENDVIEEVYNSWYSFFGIARNLIKEIPIAEMPDSKGLVQTSTDVLNNCLRPHLTKWQARFRKWYANNANEELDPQTIQKKYPAYEELKADLIKTNKQIYYYKEVLWKIALGKNGKTAKRKKEV